MAEIIKSDKTCAPSARSCFGSISKHLRLTIYSYVDLRTTVAKLTGLSKSERDELKRSFIARQGKKLKLGCRLLDSPAGSDTNSCLLHGDKLHILLSRI